MRAISDLRWRRDPDGVVVATVAADAFCQAMVRSLSGRCCRSATGAGRCRVAGVAAGPAGAGDEVVVAPPHGLTLVAVGYPDETLAVRGGGPNVTRQRRG